MCGHIGHFQWKCLQWEWVGVVDQDPQSAQLAPHPNRIRAMTALAKRFLPSGWTGVAPKPYESHHLVWRQLPSEMERLGPSSGGPDFPPPPPPVRPCLASDSAAASVEPTELVGKG